MKKLTSTLLASLFAINLIPAVPFASSAEDTVQAFGDTNSDGYVDAVDASAILGYYASISTGTEPEENLSDDIADVNSDDYIDSSDASCILSYYAYVSVSDYIGLSDFMSVFFPSEPEDNSSVEARENQELSIKVDGEVIKDTAIDLLPKVVMAEAGGFTSDETIKAQAVAAFSFIKFNNDVLGVPAVEAVAEPTERVKRLVKEVCGKGMYYNGQIIQATYFASSPGHTASAVNVWGVDYPYLKGVDTDWIDRDVDPHWNSVKRIPSSEIKTRVKNTIGVDLTGDPSTWIKTSGGWLEGYVPQVTIGGKSTYNNGYREVPITGWVFRDKIMSYTIKSGSFTIGYNPVNDCFIITTWGYGHGVGMSQNGAHILATKYGYTYDQILKFYYTGIEIK